MEFKKGDKVVVKPWSEGKEPTPGVVESVREDSRQVFVDYGKGRFQWVAVKRVERDQ